MENCLFCQKKLEHIPGRKQKSFCDVNCRNKHFYKKRSDLIAKAKEFVPDEKNGATVQCETEGTIKPAGNPKNLNELKALCPHKEGTDERRTWVATERQKYGI